jgi:hypothetical protein
MKEKLLKIINHYGAVNQRKKLCEEFMELQDELYSTYVLGNTFSDDLLSEIADVLVLIMQFVVDYGFDTIDIENEMRFKIQRQLDRIREEV